MFQLDPLTTNVGDCIAFFSKINDYNIFRNAAFGSCSFLLVLSLRAVGYGHGHV